MNIEQSKFNKMRPTSFTPVKVAHVFHHAHEKLGGAQKIIHQIHRAAGSQSRIIAYDEIWHGANHSVSSKLKLAANLLKLIFCERETFIFVHHRVFLPLTWILPSRTAYVAHNIFPSKNFIYKFFPTANYIAVSNEVANYLSNCNERIAPKVIINGLSRADDEQSKPEPDSSINIGFVGRIDHQKGVDVLFEAALHLWQNENLPIKLHLVGPPSQLGNDLLAKANALNSTEQFLNLHGYSERPFKVLSGVDILCIPSRYEGFGLVYYEALERDHFVVASRLPVFHASPTDDRTMFFEPGSVTDLINSLRAAAVACKVSQANKAKFTRHSMPSVQEMTEQYLKYASNKIKA